VSDVAFRDLVGVEVEEEVVGRQVPHTRQRRLAHHISQIPAKTILVA
jgi:hypothetical protein